MKGVFDAATTSLPKPFNDSSFFNVDKKKTRFTVNTKKEAKNADGQVVYQHTMKSQLKSVAHNLNPIFFVLKAKRIAEFQKLLLRAQSAENVQHVKPPDYDEGGAAKFEDGATKFPVTKEKISLKSVASAALLSIRLGKSASSGKAQGKAPITMTKVNSLDDGEDFKVDEL